MNQQVEARLHMGGTVTLVIDVPDWLWMTVDDFSFLKELANLMHGYTAATSYFEHEDSLPTPSPAASAEGAEVEIARPASSAATDVAARNGQLDYADIARVYAQAVAEGRKPIQALCDHFDVEHTTAKNWPNRCRELGLIPQLGEPAHHPEVGTQFVDRGRR